MPDSQKSAADESGHQQTPPPMIGEDLADRPSRAHQTPQRELLRLAELHPSYSLLQIVGLLDRDGWHLEELTESQTEAYRKINALDALRGALSLVDSFRLQFPLDSAPRTIQWLPTGQYAHVGGVVGAGLLSRLSSACDRLLGSVGTWPVNLFDHHDIITESSLQEIANTALAGLRHGLPPSSDPVILKKRTLLRRTFPPSFLGPQIGNSNNQYWHQDSNLQYNDAPMLTLWIPLQGGSGVTRPGLQIIDAPVSYFSVECGDSAPDAFDFLCRLFPGSRIVPIRAAAGDCILFNGLTFHQTSATPAMAEHRDALLIRILDKAFAHRFPAVDPDEDLVAIA